MTDAADFVTETRTFYDTVAEEYAVQFADLRPGTPLDRGVLHGFAELVGAGGEVADLGCGPGRVTAYLASQGLSVFGLDLSGSMLAIARRENPGLRFVQGSMLELDLPDGSLDGVVSWYSIIHTPEEHLPALFAGFTLRARTVREPDEASGEPVAQASLVARKPTETAPWTPPRPRPRPHAPQPTEAATRTPSRPRHNPGLPRP